MEELTQQILNCKACSLGETCINKVIDKGDINASLMFVGEAPGEQEDKCGIPFQGDAGKLLNKFILAMGLTREKVYIANTIKCRPPKNRNPEPEELEACSQFLYKEISIVRPRVIVTLGAFATKSLVDSDLVISKIRGQSFPCKMFPEIVVIPTFHPSFCLRQQSAKISVWQDLKKAMALLGLR